MSVCCYNFMPDEIWVRTDVTTLERGGGRVTAFRDRHVEQKNVKDSLAADELWNNLTQMLKELVPVAVHPDDPPLSRLAGRPQIMGNIEAFERQVRIVPSTANGICFCQGCLSEMGVDVPFAIRHLGAHIHFVHFHDMCR